MDAQEPWRDTRARELGFGDNDVAAAGACIAAYENTAVVTLACGRYRKSRHLLDAELSTVLDISMESLAAARHPKCTFAVTPRAPLSVAAFFSLARVVELLLVLGAHVDEAPRGRTALLRSAFLGDGNALKVAKLLLAHGADPTYVSPDAWTPLDAARSRGGREEMVELLEAQPLVRRALRRRTCAYCEGVASYVQPRFQVCAQCLSCRYCSRDCQKAAWRSGHRDECTPRPTRPFVKKVRRRPYTMVERAKILAMESFEELHEV